MKKVYFNSACPVCDAGVKHQRQQMEAAASCDVEWIDITRNQHALADRGITIDQVRRKLYVEDDSGTLHVGAAAFAALWRDTPGQTWRGRAISLPLVAGVARWLYDRFADILYWWNRRKGRW